MSKSEKLLQKARNNLNSLSFDDFRALMKQCAWVEDRQVGSHQIWFSPKRYRISIQNRNGKAKDYQIKQFLQQYDEENKHD